jgi:hypothetical protein
MEAVGGALLRLRRVYLKPNGGERSGKKNQMPAGPHDVWRHKPDVSGLRTMISTV